MKISSGSDPVHFFKFEWSSVILPFGSRGHREAPQHRSQHAACRQGCHIYLYGGKDGYTPLRDLWRLDTETCQWERLVPRNAELPHLQGHSMVVHKAQILIFGGTFEDSGDCPLWIYNAELNHLRSVGCEMVAEHPTNGLREHTAIVHKDTMYVYGGFLDSTGSVDHFWAFNIVQECWLRLNKPRAGKRHGHVAVCHFNSMWVHGGMRDLNSLGDLWTYSFSLKKWRQVKGTGTCPVLSNHSASMVDHSMILVGGTRQGVISQEVWLFDFDALSWHQVLRHTGIFIPATTLHCTVLVTPVEASTDRTLSVPQLQHSSPMAPPTVRPWTSPSPEQAVRDNGPPNSSSWGPQILSLESPKPCPLATPPVRTMGCSDSSSWATQIMPLESLKLHPDRNNNSLEDVTEPEAETSFSQPKVSVLKAQDEINSLHHQSQPEVYSDSNETVFNTESSQRASAVPDLKARPGPSEYSKESIPLLQRFCSVGSEAEFGVSNLAMTISDEKVHIQGNRFDEALEMKEWCSQHRQKHFGAPDFTRNMDSISECNQEKMVINNRHVSLQQGNSQFNLMSEQRKSDPRFEAQKSYFYSKSSEEIDCIKNKTQLFDFPQRKSVCSNDLILEDLEYSDVNSLFQNVSLGYTSNSVSELTSSNHVIASGSSKSLERMVYRSLSQSHLETQKSRTVSCGNLFEQEHMSAISMRKHLSELSLITKNLKNSRNELLSLSGSLEKLSKVKTKATEISGRFIKHIGGASGNRNVPNVLRKKNVYTQKDLTIQTSVATQTGSQLSLVTTQARSAEQCSERPQRQHLLGKWKAVLLMIGGQSENRTFQTENVKMYRCHLY